MSADSTKRPDTDESGPAPEAATGRQQIVDLQFLRELLAAVDESGIDSLEISRGGTRIRVAKSPTMVATMSTGGNSAQSVAASGQGHQPPPSAAPEPPPAPAAESASSLIEITSPMVGTFYRAPAPEAPSYVEVGSRIVEGQTLCILEAMKLMNELESEVEGVVREICVDNSEPVEYGQVLFRIEPTA